MRPRLWVSAVTFSDGTSLNVLPDDIIVVVGPNNAGKSAALRAIRDKVGDPARASPVVSSITVDKQGTHEDLVSWLETISRRVGEDSSDPTYSAFGTNVSSSRAVLRWTGANVGLHESARFFCYLLNADGRLQAAEPPANIAIAREPPTHPIHYLQIDDDLELKLSAQFRKAFGTDLIVHRNAGNQVPLHCGERPVPKVGQDRLSYAYIQELEKLSPLSTQGDGMRSFAGVLLHTSVGRESILLIDEPEAFLHPPQARLLGRSLAQDKPADRQLFVATHSGDVLRGLLDADSDNLRIVRLQRDGTVNHTRELDKDQIKAVWGDPLLRYSNILDGIFHEKVIVCESDSDCRFYAALLDAVCDLKGKDTRRPDVMFTHCGGKDRLPTAINALVRLGVPVAAIADFDVLINEQPLQRIIDALGGSWKEFARDWKAVKSAVDAKKPELGSDEVLKEIEAILSGITQPVFPEDAKKAIEKVLRRSSPWSLAKSIGKSYCLLRG